MAPQQALNVGAPEVAQKALRYASEFGLSHDSYKEFHPLMIYYSKQVGGQGSLWCLPGAGALATWPTRSGRAVSACRAHCALVRTPASVPVRSLQSGLPGVF